MPNPLVECVANYSEARRPEVIQAIRQSILGVPEVTLLDQHSDLDHNRTVLTFIGPPAPVEEAAFRSIAKAAELIDLDQHRGEHPRIGATDVVPFVPIRDLTMTECVTLARHLGRRVGDELGIPVYLYEDAATRPERQNLENIRHGQYEALKVEMGVNPDRDPDFGPRLVGKAGATVIGARQPLIAYNVYLTTDDVQIAKKIAKAIRFSSGGLRYVKGLGLLVDGRAQVSMNLTNFRGTPLAQVVEMIRREAVRYGVAIHHSELVGLIPQEAMVEAARWYLQIDQFDTEQILEYRLAAITELQPIIDDVTQLQLDATPTVKLACSADDFLGALAAGTPTPGGGSAAAYSGAAGAALVAMVARLTIGKQKYAEVEAQMQAVVERAETLRAELTATIERDAAAFEFVLAALKLPRQTPEQMETRNQAIAATTLQAAQVPLEVARMAVEVLELAAQVVTVGNVNAICDGATGAALARASLAGAGYNVRINLVSLTDQTVTQSMLAQLHDMENRAADLEERIQATWKTRSGII